MKVLLAEDDNDARDLLRICVSGWGYEVIATADGNDAWEFLQNELSPPLMIFDWMMGEVSGLELCRMARKRFRSAYIIMVTGLGERDQLLQGFEAGADDYMIKPFNTDELKARIQTGARIMRLQSELSSRVRELEDALSHIKQLRGLLPICSYCKKIRNEENYWQQVENYISSRVEVRFSHGVCPECYREILQPQLDSLKSSSRPVNKNT